jgi:prepilin-type processing-associated H-X9-DG protein
VFARARAKAQQTNCLNNVKEIMLGFIMYASDNDQKVQSYIADGGAATGAGGDPWCPWSNTAASNSLALTNGSLMPYLKNTQMLQCPGVAALATPICNYTVNQEIVNWRGAGSLSSDGLPYDPQTLNSITDPASTWLVGEGAAGTAYSCIGNGSGNTMGYPHNGGANLAYVDGHAKWMTQAQYLILNNWKSVASSIFCFGRDAAGVDS